MSGGSCNYIYYKIEEELVGRMEDKELDDLMRDVAKLAHSLEWYLSCDTDRESYAKTVRGFKNKWFKSDRTERLKSYIDEEINKTRVKLYEMLGSEGENEETNRIRS